MIGYLTPIAFGHLSRDMFDALLRHIAGLRCRGHPASLDDSARPRCGTP